MTPVRCACRRASSGGGVPVAASEKRWQRSQWLMWATWKLRQQRDTVELWVGSSDVSGSRHGLFAQCAAGLPLEGGAPTGGACQMGSRRSRSVPSERMWLRRTPPFAPLDLSHVHRAVGRVHVWHAVVHRKPLRVQCAGQRAGVGAVDGRVLRLDGALHCAVPPAVCGGVLEATQVICCLDGAAHACDSALRGESGGGRRGDAGRHGRRDGVADHTGGHAPLSRQPRGRRPPLKSGELAS
jgi:hypothetical protein